MKDNRELRKIRYELQRKRKINPTTSHGNTFIKIILSMGVVFLVLFAIVLALIMF